MYLKRITLAGFKSFATKTVIELEPGITAIVGPNGSGKSNVADAIRWAMGEQSRNRLRLGDRSEVIFAGSDGKARASMAEVSLIFDNSDGQLSIEASEVELTRRLYRSGESEYLLMGRSAKLNEVQLLLAQARVGAGTYAVVGQGMIDTLIMGSPAERKELFDEAAGIRADELKRESSLRQLARTQVNVTRLHDIEAELSDRLKGLDRMAETGRRVDADKSTLITLKQQLITTLAHELADDATRLEKAVKALDDRRKELEKGAKALEARNLRQIKARQDAAKQRSMLQQEQSELEQRIAQIVAERMQHEVQLTRRHDVEEELKSAREALKGLTAQLTRTGQKRRAMLREIEDLKEAVTRSESELKRLTKPIEEAQATLLTLRHSQDDGNQRQYIDHALSSLKLVAQNLLDDEPHLEQVRLLVHKTGRLLSHAARTAGPDLVAELEDARTKLEQAMAGREAVNEHITNLTLSMRSQELELAHHDEMRGSRQLEIDRLQASVRRLESELERTKQAAQALSESEKMATIERKRLESVRERLAVLDQAEGGSEERVAIAVEEERSTRAQVEITEAAAQNELMKDEFGQRTEQLDQYMKLFGLKPETVRHVGVNTRELERKIEVLESRIQLESEALEASSIETREIEARRDELRTQLADLEQAEADLRAVIIRLDSAINANFEDGFGRIAERFSHYFEELFEGGKATLALETDDENNYGIEIKASAEGKRLSSLAAMSGGERALTGVALLAAIVDAGANPFIVLDEVDAALDEANSGKFASILASLSKRTQLIVVTHNRQTMTAAPVLYGVTLGKGHASSLLSLRLEEAQSLAAR